MHLPQFWWRLAQVRTSLLMNLSDEKAAWLIKAISYYLSPVPAPTQVLEMCSRIHLKISISLPQEHQNSSKLQPRDIFFWVHHCSSALSCHAFKLYLVRFPRSGDWLTIGGWQLSVAGQAVMSEWVRAPEGAEGNISALALLWRLRVHRWAWSQTGNVTVVKSWDKTRALSLILVHSFTLLATRPITWEDRAEYVRTRLLRCLAVHLLGVHVFISSLFSLSLSLSVIGLWLASDHMWYCRVSNAKYLPEAYASADGDRKPCWDGKSTLKGRAATSD